MNNILVMVGTTRFDGLLNFFDVYSSWANVTLQVGDSGYVAKHAEVITYVDNIEELIDSSDYVVSHAGAGNVYNLLEKGTKFLVVPNTERFDQHQAELAEYLKGNNLCPVLYLDELSKLSINDVVSLISGYVRSPYKKQEFFAQEDILNFFNLS